MKKICKAMLLLAAFNFSIGSVGTNKHEVYADTCQLKSSVDLCIH